MQYIYLHGFASSPRSNKAQYLRDRFAEIGINLNLLDLNQGDFSHLTLTRQIQQTVKAFPSPDTPITIIGSSFGGLTAVWLGEKYPQVQRLVLLAPAFNFLAYWLPKLGEAQIQQWQKSGYLPIYHYGEEQMLPLHYQFVVDAHKYDQSQLKRSVSTLIIHGLYDDVIPIEASRNYISEGISPESNLPPCTTRQCPWIQLIELESDHALTDVRDKIWQLIKIFCNLG